MPTSPLLENQSAPPAEPLSSTPLLPASWSGPMAFGSLWLLPISILLLLNVQGYRLIEGNMSAAERQTAVAFGGANGALLVAGALLAIVSGSMARRSPDRRGLSRICGVLAIVLPAAYLWLAVAWLDAMLPASVRAWLYPETQFLFNQFAFAMVPLFWGVLRLASEKLTSGLRRSLALSAGSVVAAPVLLYLFLRYFYSGFTSSFGAVVFSTAVVLGGIVLFCALCRCVLLGLHAVHARGPTAERIAIVALALVLPLAGLWLNRSIPFPVTFQAWEVYALTVANAAILLFASYRQAQSPRGSFWLLAFTLPFSLYFFVVFLPYTPLSILAVIALGAGFLVLAPVLLFVLHLHLLHRAHRALTARPDHGLVVAVAIGAALVLPAFVTVRALADKAALNAALDYVYTPAIETQPHVYPASRLNLRRALDHHRDYKQGIFYPLLSPYYSWLVFNHLILPDEKLALLEKTFFGPVEAAGWRDPFASGAAPLRHRSVRDRERGPRTQFLPRSATLDRTEVVLTALDANHTRLSLRLQLSNPDPNSAEYVLPLQLPAGVFVAGFRLHVNGTPVDGRITEKKTALWVYQMIRDTERRDPGILFYDGNRSLELRVFPVVAAQPSIVEIDFLVPLTTAQLAGLPANSAPGEVLARTAAVIAPRLHRAGETTVFIDGAHATPWPAAPRPAYFHLVIDRSADGAFTGSWPDTLARLRAAFPGVTHARVSWANFDVVPSAAELVPLAALARWSPMEVDGKLSAEGGFALDRAVAAALVQHRDIDLDRNADRNAVPPQPLIVVLSRNSTNLSAPGDLLSPWVDLAPGVAIYQFASDKILPVWQPAGGHDTPLLRVGHSVRPLVTDGMTVFAPSAAAPVEYFDPSAKEWRTLREVQTTTPSAPWDAAVALHLQQARQLRSPGDAPVGPKALVEASRASGILIPSTSYIVVENSAQWRMLEQAERTKLGQNSALEFRETPAPGALWTALGFGAYLWFRRRRSPHRTRDLEAQPACARRISADR